MKRILNKISNFLDDDINMYGTAIGMIAVAMLLERLTEPRSTLTVNNNENQETL